MNDSNRIIDVTAENVDEVGIYCIKNKKSPGYKSKVDWFKSNSGSGLKIKIVTDKHDKQLGFIEYIPSEFAWRPVKAPDFLFIQCIAIFVKKAKNKQIGTALLKSCEKDAADNKKYGVCVMTSEGVWMANRSLFEKNDYQLSDKLGRFELLAKKFDQNHPDPQLLDWTINQPKYKGWNLIYADQCPWHEKSVTDLKKVALDKRIKLKVKELKSAKEAQQAPSGFGVFSLIKDGRLLADHYISKTRFENILKQETQ